MKVKIDIEGDLVEILRNETRRTGLAMTIGVRQAGETLKGLWRGQVKASGLGNRLANTIRHDAYPKKGFSYHPASKVYTKASEIIDAFDRGAIIQAKSGYWLAIPTNEAGKRRGGKQITPAEWEARAGRKLRFVHNRKRRTAFLVADDLRVSKRSGIAKPKGGRRRRDGILTGAQTVPIFVLVPQAKMPHLLHLMADARRVEAQLPTLIVSNMRDGK